MPTRNTRADRGSKVTIHAYSRLEIPGIVDAYPRTDKPDGLTKGLLLLLLLALDLRRTVQRMQAPTVVLLDMQAV